MNTFTHLHKDNMVQNKNRQKKNKDVLITTEDFSFSIYIYIQKNKTGSIYLSLYEFKSEIN
jgi:hypothetical protein